MSNTPGYFSVEESVPLSIIPDFPSALTSQTSSSAENWENWDEKTQIDKVENYSTLNFREHMYGGSASQYGVDDSEVKAENADQVTLNIRFGIFPGSGLRSLYTWATQSRQCRTVGEIEISGKKYTILNGFATLYPFSGSYTSAVFFRYQLIVTDSSKNRFYFYGEKIARPWSFKVGIFTNIWRIWKNVSSQRCWLWKLDGQKVGELQYKPMILNIAPLEYPFDQILGVKTPHTWWPFSWILTFLWFVLLYFNIFRTHLNSNAREITNYWTSSRGAFAPKKSTYSNWDASVEVQLDKDHFKEPLNRLEVTNTIIELQKVPDASLRLVGSGHSFNLDILRPHSAEPPRSTSYMLELSNLRRILVLNLAAGWVEVEGGVQLRRLVEVLHDHGFTLPNHGAYLVQTVAGALSTGTHGTSGAWTPGENRGTPPILAAVLGGELITETGVVQVTQENVVTLGLVGVLVKVRLQIVPINYLKQRQLWTPHTTCLQYDYIYQQLYNSKNKFVEIRGPTGASAASVYLYEAVPSVSTVQTIFNFFLRYLLMWFYDAASFHLPLWFYRLSYALLTRFLGVFPQIDVNSWTITKDYAPPHEETEWAIPFDKNNVTEALKVLNEVANDPQSPGAKLLGEFHIRFDVGQVAWVAPSSERDTMYIDLNFPHSRFLYTEKTNADITKVFALWQEKLLKRVPLARPHWSKRFEITDSLRDRIPILYSKLKAFQHFAHNNAATKSIFQANPFAQKTQILQVK